LEDKNPEAMLNYLISFLIMGSIYGMAALALNLQWGFTGLMNFGLGAFYMLGAYSSAILTAPPTAEHLGGFGLPVVIGFAGAALVAGAVAFLIAFPALRLRGGPFAIALLAIHETLLLVVRNESWLTNGVWGIRNIPRPFFDVIDPRHYGYVYLLIAGGLLILLYLAIQKVVNSPWGRVLKCIREDEDLTAMSGKNARNYKIQSFVFGSMAMGLAGASYVHYTGFVSPQVFNPLMSTFIVWLMVMVGGTGNNRGVVVGAFLVWAVWVGSDFLTDFVPAVLATRIGFIRLLFVGIILGFTVLTRPQGILSRKKLAGEWYR
jgi:branched-chain amino acid transport system permease protein